MAFYSVLIPPPGSGGPRQQIERAELVPEGFAWGAFVFSGFWLLFRRLWIATLLFALVWGLLLWLRTKAGLGPGTFMLAQSALSLLLALEGNNLIVRKRQWQGWRLVDVVEARDLAEAERRYFERALAAPEAQRASAPAPAAPPQRGPVPVIGLFPEAQGR